MRVIRGKKTFITGAASGIGRSLSLRLAEEGSDLFLVDVDASGLTDVVSQAKGYGVKVIGQPCDLTQPKDIERVIAMVLQRWGGVDILVNNAGICFYGTTTEMTDRQWNQLLSVNLLAPAQITRALLPNLLQRPEAHVLNVASMYAFISTNRCSAYHLTKYGILGFTQALRAEYRRTRLGFTALCPGFVRTALFTSMPNQSRPQLRIPPAIVSTTPDRVAEKAVQAIYRNQRIALVTPLAYAAYYLSRIAPGAFDLLYRVGRHRVEREQFPSAPLPSGFRVVGAGDADEQGRRAA